MKLNLKNRLLGPFDLASPAAAFFLIVSVFLADMLSKMFAYKYWQVSCNQGVAFGFGSDGKIVSFVALIIVFWLLAQSKQTILRTGLSFVVAGGIANLVDRVATGCVRDFIEIGSFPSFNLADIAITFGAVVILYHLFLESKK